VAIMAIIRASSGNEAPSGACDLGGNGRVLSPAVGPDWTKHSPADRGPVGIRLPRWHDDAFNTGRKLPRDLANYAISTYPVDRRIAHAEEPFPSQASSPTPGLYDMHGNVWQWCSDWYGDYPAGDAIDPKGADNGLSRVLRGGSWDYYPASCRAACRLRHPPVGRDYGIGFRLCLDF